MAFESFVEAVRSERTDVHGTGLKMKKEVNLVTP